jgi:hypothetical protein
MKYQVILAVILSILFIIIIGGINGKNDLTELRVEQADQRAMLVRMERKLDWQLGHEPSGEDGFK